MQNALSKLSVAVMALLLPLALISCGGDSSSSLVPEARAESVEQVDQPATKAEVAPLNVRTWRVVATTLDEVITVSGETAADKDVTYSSEVAGRVEYIPVELGQRLHNGQGIARINYEESKAQAEQAQAAYDLARASFNRLSALRSEELVSQQAFDEARAAYVQSEAQLKIVQVQLGKSVIRSSIDGMIVRKFVEQGEFVAPGSPIVQAIDYRTIIVKAQLPETSAHRVRSGQTVRVRVDALSEAFTGKVDVVLPAADPVSKTFELRVKVDNRDHRIRVGMAATVSIELEKHENVVAVNQDVVVEEGHARSVFVNEDGRALRREVKLGPTRGHKVILTEGLNPGDEVVVLGQRSLVDGQPVRVVKN